MSVGKAASQGGHAFLQAFMAADEDRRKAYHKDGLGTKICLSVKNLGQLMAVYRKSIELGLPCALIEDTGRNTTFNGVPTISAVGIGPLTAEEATVLRRIQLFP